MDEFRWNHASIVMSKDMIEFRIMLKGLAMLIGHSISWPSRLLCLFNNQAQATRKTTKTKTKNPILRADRPLLGRLVGTFYYFFFTFFLFLFCFFFFFLVFVFVFVFCFWLAKMTLKTLKFPHKNIWHFFVGKFEKIFWLIAKTFTFWSKKWLIIQNFGQINEILMIIIISQTGKIKSVGPVKRYSFFFFFL